MVPPQAFSLKPSALAPRSPARSSPRLHTHRFVLVLQAPGGHIRHGRGRAGISATRSPDPHARIAHRSAIPRGQNNAGETNWRRKQTSSLSASASGSRAESTEGACFRRVSGWAVLPRGFLGEAGVFLVRNAGTGPRP